MFVADHVLGCSSLPFTGLPAVQAAISYKQIHGCSTDFDYVDLPSQAYALVTFVSTLIGSLTANGQR